jgi:DNA modification methylase
MGRTIYYLPIRVGRRSKADKYPISPLRNGMICGDCLVELDKLPKQSVDLAFTSPPYFNARPELAQFQNYDEYLEFLVAAIRKVARVLVDGRFLVINTAPVLVPRDGRIDESQRLAIPFDLHPRILDAGFDFIDDIIRVKPEGAGCGRSRRFAIDRNPPAYNTTPITEYVLVYRKKSDRLIDWFLHNHPDRTVVEASRLQGDYEPTNVWRINPAYSPTHPAVFPLELAERVIRYYLFQGDVVLNPFAGIGTVGTAAMNLGRRFCLIERQRIYVDRFLEAESARYTWLLNIPDQ